MDFHMRSPQKAATTVMLFGFSISAGWLDFLKHQQYFTELNTSSLLVHDHRKLHERKLLRENSLIVDDFH